MRKSSIPGAGLGVFAETTIPANTRLGPFEGIIYAEATNEDQSYVWIVGTHIFFCISGRNIKPSSYYAVLNNGKAHFLL